MLCTRRLRRAGSLRCSALISSVAGIRICARLIGALVAAALVVDPVGAGMVDDDVDADVAAGANEALADVVKGVAEGKKAVVSGFHDATGDAALNAELAKALRSEEVTKAMNESGATITTSTPQEMGQMIATDLTKWAALIKERNLKAD
mgnify:CR=1 FL=1